MARDPTQDGRHVLDPVERASETTFGVLMATTFTGSLSVATAGREEVRTMMLTALGCNIAWGITDAVMYLVGTATERHRRIALLRDVQATEDAQAGQRRVADALPERLADGATPAALEAIRKRLRSVAIPSQVLGRQDLADAFGVFVLVVLSTFPVVIPFLFFSETQVALRVSNLLAIVAVFASGLVLGRYAGGTPWRYGLAMTAIAVALVGIIVALGG